MCLVRLRFRWFVALSLIVLGGVVCPNVAPAGKPGSGGGGTIPPAPGTIFFSTPGGAMSMSGNGSGKTAAPSVGWPGIRSFQQHAGSRWFLGQNYDFNGITDPWGNPPVELFAVNASNTWVQLTSDPNIVWTGLDRPAWGKDDSFISFQGVKDTGTAIVGGLFVVPIDWSSGSPVAGPSILAVQTEVYVSDVYWWYSGVNVFDHDWSPDASKVVFEAIGPNGWQLQVATWSASGVVRSGLPGNSIPVWSPDGSRIAFTSGGTIWTIKPDGTAAVQLTQATSTNKETRRQGGPTWSPDSAFIAFTEALTTNNGQVTRSVLRIPSGGGATVNLTSELGQASSPIWRQ